MNLSFVQRGEGKDLVFLHGYLASKESFAPQIDYFGKFYRVTALDFPGMGGAEPLRAAWSVSDYADWTEEALARLHVENPNLIAHSFGGRVSIKLLARGRVDRAALTGCAGIVKRRTLSYRMKVKFYRFMKKVAPMYAERRFGSEEYRSLSPVMRESFKKIVNEDLRADASAITRPVLYLCGREDTETPPEQVKLLQSCTKGSSFLLLDGGHFTHLENPLAFSLAVEEFLHADL